MWTMAKTKEEVDRSHFPRGGVWGWMGLLYVDTSTQAAFVGFNIILSFYHSTAAIPMLSLVALVVSPRLEFA